MSATTTTDELAGERPDAIARARRVAKDVVRPSAIKLDETGGFPTESFGTLAGEGLLGIVVPESYGGLGLGPLELVGALREVATECASTAVGMSVTNMVAETICRFGTAEQCERFVPEITSGRAVAGSFCLSEPGSGSDAGSLKATATADGDHYVLNGTKMWITSGAYAGVFIVMARTSGQGTRGISAFLIERDHPGLSFGAAEHKTGLLGSNTVPVHLDGCRVPASQMLSSEGSGFKIAMTALDGGRITIGAMACGIARAALRGAEPHANLQGQATLFQLAARARAAEALVAQAARDKAASLVDGTRYSKRAAMAKLYATEMAREVTMGCVALAGRAGTRRQAELERLARDARVTTIFEGTSEIQQLVIGRAVLAEVS